MSILVNFFVASSLFFSTFTASFTTTVAYRLHHQPVATVLCGYGN